MQHLPDARRADRRVLAVLAVVLGLLGAHVAAASAPVRGSSGGSTAHLDPGLPAVGDRLQKVIATARGGVATALYGEDELLTVFWGPRPRAGRFVPGESSEPVRLGGV